MVLDNTDGTLLTNSDVTIHADSISNDNGRLSSAQSIALTTQKTLSNQLGEITSSASVEIVSGELNNDQGRIQSRDRAHY